MILTQAERKVTMILMKTAFSVCESYAHEKANTNSGISISPISMIWLTSDFSLQYVLLYS